MNCRVKTVQAAKMRDQWGESLDRVARRVQHMVTAATTAALVIFVVLGSMYLAGSFLAAVSGWLGWPQ